MSAKRPTKRGVVYDNGVMLRPDGLFMSRIGKKRAKWYLDRDLAEVIKNDPLTIRLKFEPNGPGHSGIEYYEQELKNQCSCCGCEEGLTSHHVVPYGFRRFMPSHVKQSNHHDILPLCGNCHNDYEKVAGVFKKKIYNDYGIVEEIGISGILEPLIIRKARGYAATIMKHGDAIPEDRLCIMKDAVCEAFGDCKEETLRTALIPPHKLKEVIRPGQAVISKIDSVEDLESFIKVWRKHFWDFATERCEGNRPKYFPNHWSIDFRIERNS